MSRKVDELGNRMKGYENVSKIVLPKRMPVLIRIDGKAFHTFTRGMKRPFDEKLSEAMWETCKFLAANIQGCKLAYTQSDEITLLLTNYDKLTTDSYFDNELQKIVSISASLATVKFNEEIKKSYPEKGYAMFDSRAWVVPHDEVCNAFIWRQQDATKNSISMVAQANFSHKSLQNLNGHQLQDKLYEEKGINWNDLPIWQKRGVCIIKKQKPKEVIYEGNTKIIMRNSWEVDFNTPIFTQDREYIEKHVYLNKEDVKNVTN